MKNLKLFKESFFDNVVVVTGTYCSGKSMVSPIVSSLNNVEHVRKLITVDQILHLARLKKIEKNVAIFLVRHYLDKNFYEQLIGRNINFRIGDETSIFTAKNTTELMNRIFLKRGDRVIKKHISKKTIFCMDTHDGIMLFDYWKEMNKKFKFINIYRNPIDTAASWHKWGKGNHEKILFNEVIMLKNNNYTFPLYYADNYQKYPKKNAMDRVIDMVLYCQKREYLNFKKFKKSKNCIFIEYEDFATNTDKNINKICKFLKTRKSNKTKKIMDREKCPRIIDDAIHREKLKQIKFLSTKKTFQKLLDFEKVFIKRKNGIL